MKWTTLAAAAAVTLAFAQTAQAREHHHRHAVFHRHGVYHEAGRHWVAYRYAATRNENYNFGWSYRNAGTPPFAWPAQNAYHGGYGARPQGWSKQSTYNGGYGARRRAWSTQSVYRSGYGGSVRTWSTQSAYRGGYGGRPRAWCGWQMRQLVGGDPGPQFNLARNWARWGRPGPAGIGAVVVWAHHVGKIVGREGGKWVIQSGNDGNRVRTRPLSIGGAIAIRWG